MSAASSHQKICPRSREFFDNLDRINALAEASPGFIWRLQSEAGNATDIKPTADPLLHRQHVGVAIDAHDLFNFVYQSAHTPVMGQRRNWFERPEGAYQALWWITPGHVPSIEEGLSKLWAILPVRPDAAGVHIQGALRCAGTSGGTPVDMKPDPWCVGHA